MTVFSKKCRLWKSSVSILLFIIIKSDLPPHTEPSRYIWWQRGVILVVFAHLASFIPTNCGCGHFFFFFFFVIWILHSFRAVDYLTTSVEILRDYCGICLVIIYFYFFLLYVLL